ncbi:MAG: hypothetical protein AAF429_10800 [Pseudomonadota bacterium]
MLKFFTALIVIGLFGTASPSEAKKLNENEVKALLIGNSETGEVIAASVDDLGKKGTSYVIKYFSDGSLSYSTSSGRSGKGKWQFLKDALCRSFEDGAESCRNIVKRGKRYKGVGFNSGKTRYRFTVN